MGELQVARALLLGFTCIFASASRIWRGPPPNCQQPINNQPSNNKTSETQPGLEQRFCLSAYGSSHPRRIERASSVTSSFSSPFVRISIAILRRLRTVAPWVNQGIFPNITAFVTTQLTTSPPRQDLLGWLNSLLQLNMTKVEQCGTGAALCQVYDSIFLDLPMARVKFNANTDYAYLENFKILSNTFRKHHIDRPIPVQELIKCKMQDNLEFLQWTKRYWDQYYPGGDYDALARRKGAPAGAAPSMPPAGRMSGAGTTRKPLGAAAGAAAPRATSRNTGGAGGAASAVLQQKNAELVETVQGLERERDFYFSKLRDIELLIQQAVEADPTLDEDEGSLLKQIQTILYSTEVSYVSSWICAAFH